MSSRGVRSLEALSRSASTSRVLNLHHVAENNKDTPEYFKRPFFSDQALNRAIIVKHRLRPDEAYLLPRGGPVATKVIFPFNQKELRTGGQSVLVGQHGYIQGLKELLGESSPGFSRDIEILELISNLPSLDPFLLREYLLRAGHNPADCYFEISPTDIERMRNHAAEQIRDLIALAFGDNDADQANGIKDIMDA